MGERAGLIAKVPEVKQSNSNSRVRMTERLQSMDTPVDRILFLQRTVGNQAVSRLMRSGALQAKLRIGQPGDVYEQEADRVADAVMRMPEPGVQREFAPEEEEEEKLQAKPLAGQITPLVQVQRQEEPEEEEETLQAKPIAEEITPLVQKRLEPEKEEEDLFRKPIEKGNKKTIQTEQMPGTRRMEQAIYNLIGKTWFCPPVSESLNNVMKGTRASSPITIKSSGIQTNQIPLGFTKIDTSSNPVCIDSNTLKCTPSGKQLSCTVNKVVPSLTITSKFAQVQSYNSGQKYTPSKCKTSVPVFLMVTKNVSKLAKIGEQEHCDDLTRAYNMTVKPCAAAVNKLAGQNFTCSKVGDCYKTFFTTLGFSPIDCTNEFVTLSNKTTERDSKGWHDFDTFLSKVSCSKVEVGLKKSKTNKVGDPAHTPAKHIGTSATKCPAVATASSKKKAGKTKKKIVK